MKKQSIKRYIIIFLILSFIYLYYNIYRKENFTNPNCSTSNISCSTKVYDIIICIGQSNMTGPSVSNTNISGSYLTDPLYSDDINYVIHPKVDKVLFDTNNRTNISICKSTETNNNYSMATSFGREYSNRTGKNVLIINVAKRSTGILKRASVNSEYVWQKTNSSAGLALYPLAKDFINSVKAKVCNTSKVIAICYQGSEEDSYLSNKRGHTCGYQVYDTQYINNYNNKMSDLLNSFKSDIGDSNTKILVGGLLLGTSAHSSGHECSEYFTNNVLKYVANTNNYIFVSTDSNSRSSLRYLQRRLDGPGGVHFNKISQIELGKRYANSYFT